MIGISAIYPYIPRYRINISTIDEAWGRKGNSGSLALRNHDEDTITMAVNALSSADKNWEGVDFLVFSTTSNPFIEGSGINIMAAVLGLRDDCHLYDINQMIRSGTKGLELGLALLAGKERKKGIIVAADGRCSGEGSELETLIGDGACAVELGNFADVVAEVKSFATSNDFTYDTWQLSKHDHLLQGDAKYSSEQSVTNIVKVGREIMEKEKISPETIDWLIVTSGQPRIKKKVALELGINSGNLVSSELDEKVGYTGASAPFFALNDALLQAKAGETILLIHEGSGVDGFLFEVTENVEKFKKQNKFYEMLANQIEIQNYNQFLLHKGKKSRNGLKPFSTTVLEKRERMNNYQLKAQKCTSCGAIHFPGRKNCSSCFSREEMEWISLDKQGTIYTFTHDHLFPGEDKATTMAVIDLDNGGRIFTQMTDYEYGKVKIGDRIQLSFRKIHEGGDFPNYFWKAVPVKEEI